RLRDQIDGAGRRRTEKRAAREAQGQVRSLRSSPSEVMSRLGQLFRISHRLNDGKTAARLMQAGMRGRPAVLKYLVFRVVSPVALFAVGMLLATASLPAHAPLWQKIGCVVGFTVFGYYLPPLLLRNQIDKRKVEIGRAWPDAVDLLLICVETGMSIEHAFKRISIEMAGTSLELAKEMSLANAELNYLQERRQAYENMANRIDLDAVKAVMGCLIQSERYGTSLGTSLRVLAQESREMRMAAAEKKAAALPPKLTVPMILFFLPVLFAVIITPAVLQATAQ
ncbi:MAG: type II secretion system F family protein, partial [Pseudomonadota bacterium]